MTLEDRPSPEPHRSVPDQEAEAGPRLATAGTSDVTVRPAELRDLREIARDLGADDLAADADAAGERLADRRFFVACVGQFKRGKSTLINALVGHAVLPVGVEPVTSVVTVLRAGPDVSARVMWPDGRVEPLAVSDLASVVDERRNPGNRRGVAGIEVFLPSPILEDGLCLVDTPGVGSVFAANTAATHAFLPHVDAALVVLGADPPVSEIELRLIVELARDIQDFVFVLNKADRLSSQDVEDATAFTERVLSGSLGRAPELLLVSALERAQGRVTRDWEALATRLHEWSGAKRAAMLAQAESRAVRRLSARLTHEIEERISALTRPLEATEAWLGRLRGAIADTDRSLVDLSHLLSAAEADLGRRFEALRFAFLADARAAITSELDTWIENAASTPMGRLRPQAIEQARRVVERQIDEWRVAVEPEAETLYEKATARFVSLANQCLAKVASDNPRNRLTVEPGFHERRHFFFANLMFLTSTGPWTWIADRLPPRAWRWRRLAADVRAYALHLLDSNAMRVENDLRERVLESRRWLEREVRLRLDEAVSSGERAVEEAKRRQSESESAVRQRVAHLHALRTRVAGVTAEPSTR